jgi:hypothetical protein
VRPGELPVVAAVEPADATHARTYVEVIAD